MGITAKVFPSIIRHLVILRNRLDEKTLDTAAGMG